MILILVVLVTLLCLFSWIIKPKNFPPGPIGIPIFGNSLQLKKLIRQHGSLNSALNEISLRYGSSLIGLKLGSKNVVITFGQSTIDALNNRLFDGRPDDFFTRQRTMGKRKGITGVDGPIWEQHRRFVKKSLRDFGYGKSIMEMRIVETVRDSVETFKRNGTGVDLSSHMSSSIMDILWMFVAGEVMEKDDPQLETLDSLLKKRSKAFDVSGGLLNHLPWIRFFAPEMSGYNLILSINNEIHQFLSKLISKKKMQHIDEMGDIIAAYLKRMEEDYTKSTFDEEQLMMVCLDLFIAGSNTTSAFLNFAFYVLILQPEIQIKIHEEIDRNIAGNTIALSDTKKLPFLMATINEIQRCYCIFPIIGPRRTVGHVEINGYSIPRNTTVLCSIESLHQDPRVWGDPGCFRPERFLNERGDLINLEKNYTFGLGRRRCLADTLAKNFIFMFLAGVFQHFCVSSCDALSNEFESGIIVEPKPYRVNFTQRQI